MPLPRPCYSCGKVYNRLTRFSTLCSVCIEARKIASYAKTRAKNAQKRLQSKQEALKQIRRDLKEFQASMPRNGKLGGSAA